MSSSGKQRTHELASIFLPALRLCPSSVIFTSFSQVVGEAWNLAVQEGNNGVSRGFDELLERILREHEEKPDEHRGTDMASVLLEAYRDENAEYKITKKQIKSFVVDIFIAGTDISALTTQGIMAEIINNPDILKRLREEIDSVVGNTRLIQETDLPKLPYLQAVVKEGLRLHPPTPLMIRAFEEGCEVRGFYIPAKTTLVVNGYAVMRDRSFILGRS